jgi:hypothetical protein
MKKQKYGRTVKRYKILRTPEITAASSTAAVAPIIPPPEMVRIDNTGVVRIHWSDATVYTHEGKLFVEANGIHITINKRWKLPNYRLPNGSTHFGSAFLSTLTPHFVIRLCIVARWTPAIFAAAVTSPRVSSSTRRR